MTMLQCLRRCFKRVHLTRSDSQFTHDPVMLNEIYEAFEPVFITKKKAVYYDLTLGLGGHAKKMLDSVEGLNVVGIDRDQAAIDLATKRLEKYQKNGQFHTFKGTYDQIDEAVLKTKLRPDTILFDLGVSSMQIDDPNRGFAYNSNQELDMRMSKENDKVSIDAKELIERATEDELRNIISKYSSERYALSISQSIKKRYPKTTYELADAVRQGLPALKRKSGSTYAMQAIKRVFQSIRIAVNNEMYHLEQALPKAINELTVNGVICILTYHSLEENIVKDEFKKGTENYIRSNVPKNMPITNETLKKFNQCGNSISYIETVKSSRKPSEDEIYRNSRAKSAKLRVIRKINETILKDGSIYAI